MCVNEKFPDFTLSFSNHFQNYISSYTYFFSFDVITVHPRLQQSHLYFLLLLLTVPLSSMLLRASTLVDPSTFRTAPLYLLHRLPY